MGSFYTNRKLEEFLKNISYIFHFFGVSFNTEIEELDNKNIFQGK